MRVSGSIASALILAAVTTPAHAQDRGAVLLDQQLRGLTTTARVLLIGAHPDDENTPLIAWLARGQRVETAYLSLTRGESGVNAAGSDFGDVLGAVRTAEVLAARRIDGARQYFTRAADFGLSKSAKESYDHWPHDAVLGDVVTVIRSFRPHVIVALFTGTPADSNGHHEVSALLAREAFELAADTVQFPVGGHGNPWAPLKLYGPGRGLTIDVSGYDAVLGRTYADIAAESRAQHRTQGYPDSLLRGAVVAQGPVRMARIASRLNPENASGTERSLFDGVDTSFARLTAGMPDTLAQLIALTGAYADSARTAVDLRRPDGVVRYLARAARLAALARSRTSHCLHPDQDASAVVSARAGCRQPWLEVDASLDLVRRRAVEALLAAAGVSIEMTTDRELVAFSDSVKATLTITNNGRTTVQFVTVSVSGVPDYSIRPREIPPDSTARWTTGVRLLASTEPWWFGEKLQDLYPNNFSVLDGLGRALTTGLVTVPAVAIPEDIRRASDVTVTMRVGGEVVTASAGPIIFRTADPLVGVQERPVSGVPSVGLSFDHSLEWIPIRKPIDRLLRFSVRSYADTARKLLFGLVAPPSVRVESLPPSVTLRPHEAKELVVRMRGSIKEGRFMFGILGRDDAGAEFDQGLRTIQYPHLPPLRMSRGSAMWLKGVDINVPGRLNVAYLQGAGDLIATYFRQLGVQINVLSYDELLNTDLSQFTTIVVGVRAYEVHPELVAYNGKLLDFVRRGGTLVVQGGTNAIYSIGIFPYVLDAPPTGGVDRVTVEEAPVKVLNPAANLFNWPNRITERDWTGWVTERAAYMPRVIDPRYTPLLEMHDPGEPEQRGALLVTTLGRGMYIYTTLALHRQLQGAVSGGARLFVNLLSAGLAPEPAKKTAR